MLRVLLSRLLRNIWHFCHNSTQRRDLGGNGRGGERSEEEVACKRELEGISLLLLDFFGKMRQGEVGWGRGGWEKKLLYLQVRCISHIAPAEWAKIFGKGGGGVCLSRERLSDELTPSLYYVPPPGR